MSSLRNAVKRITHKERSQPKHREKLGILEKKSDYKKRAKDYHRKQDAISQAQQRAAMRNPDEFYFGMQNTQVVQGRHSKTDRARQKDFEQQIGADTVRIMKDQDLKYVRHQQQRDTRKVEKLQSNLHHIENNNEKKQRRHTVFVETKQEADQFDVAEHFGTLPELAGRAFNRPRVSDLQKQASNNNITGSDDDQDAAAVPITAEQLKVQERRARKLARKAARARATAYGEMEARKARIHSMKIAEAHLVTEQLVGSKGRKRKIKEAENGMPPVYKWRRKRQR